MVFLFVSMVSSFEVDNDTDDLVGIGEEKRKKKERKKKCASLCHNDAVRSRTKANLYSDKNETVLSCGQRLCFKTCPSEQEECIVFHADEYHKRFCLARASTCFWIQGTEYLQQVTQSAQFQPVLGTSNLIFYWETYMLV